MIGIYKITNPKGKIYIGQSVNIESRKRVYSYFNSYKNSIGPVLTNSFKKYSWKNHIFEIIEECSIEQLNERETYWKQYYLNQMNGDWKQVMFCNLHDTGGGPLSKKTKQKISQNKIGTSGYPKGVKRPKEFGEKISSHPTRNKKISDGNKGKLKPQIGQILQGIPLTEQHKKNISNSSKGKTRNNKPILQYDLEGNFIKEWIGRTEAKKWLGSGDIAGCLSGKQKQAGGFIWKLKK
jgi:group I intron endonuclease